MKRIFFLALMLSITSASNLFAAGSLEDDFLQDSSPEYEQMSTMQAKIKYDKCLSTPSHDLCRKELCEFEYCTNLNRWRDVQSRACNSEMQRLTKCRKDTAEERLAIAAARRERQKVCDGINQRFMQEYGKNNISVCRQLAGENSDCSWNDEWARLFKCKKLNDQFDAATKNKNLSRMKELKATGDTQNCPWVGKAEGIIHVVHEEICQNKKGQFESHFKQKNISQCRDLIDQSLTCDWIHDAEPRLNLIDPSLESFETPPPTPLSECLSMEAAYNQALRDGNSAACAMWLENAAGCSWRDKIVTQNEVNPPPTIGPDDSSPGSDGEETNPPSPFATSGGHYSDPDNEPGDPSPFATSGGQYSNHGDVAETTHTPPPSLPDQPDCKALEGNFNFAMTSGDINWARSVLADAESCPFHSTGQAMVCQILQGSFRDALRHQNWSSAQATFEQGRNCSFASNAPAQIQSAQMAAECTKLRQEFSGLMARGQSLQARNTLHKASELGCTIPNADFQALNQALEELDQEYQQRAQQREDQQQALFSTVMSGMTAMAEANQKRREEQKNGNRNTKFSGNSSSGSSSTYNFPERQYAGQEASPYTYSGKNTGSASGSGSSGKCQGHRNAVYCGGQPVSGLVSLDTNHDGICDICKKSCKNGGKYIRGTATQSNCGTKTKTKYCPGHTFICAKNKKREGLALDVDIDGICDICHGVVHINRGGWGQSTSDSSCKEVK